MASQGLIFEDISYGYEVVGIGDCKDKRIVIPSEYNMKPVVSIDDEAFIYCTSITSVFIPHGVTRIGDGAFKGCRALTEVILPDDLTTLGSKVFQYCVSLRSIIIPGGLSYVPLETFEGCVSLTDVVLSSAAKYVQISAFNGCISLINVYYTERLKDCLEVCVDSYNSAFDNATKFYYSGTNPMSNGNFWHYMNGKITVWENTSACSSTNEKSSEVTLGAYHYKENADTPKDTSIPSVSVGLNYKKVGDAFAVTGRGSCNDANLVIPSEYMNLPVVSIEKLAFFHENFTSVVIPSSVVEIGEGAFMDCESVESVSIPDSVLAIECSAFYGCKSLTSVIIPDGVISIGSEAFFSCTSLKTAIIPNSVTAMGSEIFEYCRKLTTVTLPNTLTDIPDKMFEDCRDLRSIIIPDSVTYIGYLAFDSCYSLVNLTVPASVTEIAENAFLFCDSLVEVCNLSELDIEIGSDENGAVAKNAKNVYTETSGKSFIHTTDNGFKIYDDNSGTCYLLGYYGTENNPVFPKLSNGMKCIIYDHAFYDCRQLENLTLPNGVVLICYAAFDGCTQLKSVNIPDTVTLIDDFAFSNCTSLTSVIIPDSVISMGISVFNDCTALGHVSISAKVTSLKERSFLKCEHLRYVIIPQTVSSIEKVVFYECSSLSRIYYMGNMDDWSRISIGEKNDPLSSSTIYFYRNERPSEEGNFWHYDDSGDPIAW